MKPALGRRRFLMLLGGSATAALAASIRGYAQVDQGIGGTGAAPGTGDQGIGGTGVIGTIRRFGSIVVNGLRIAYPTDVNVTLDGQPATPAALKIGHVVRVVAQREGGALQTRAIEVTSEVVGRIERIEAKSLIVAGQSVSTSDLPGTASYKVGDHVGVGGLRRNDGVIAASIIESRPSTINRVAGPVVRSADGSFAIGALTLSGLPASFAGKRAVVEGKRDAQRFEVTQARSEQELLGPGVRRLSVEAYVERSGGGLRLGSGLAVSGSNTRLRGDGVVRAVITTGIERGGELRVQSLKLTPAAAKRPPRETLRERPRRASKKDALDKPQRGDLNDLGSNRIAGQRPSAGANGRGAPGRSPGRGGGRAGPFGGGGHGRH